MSKRTNLSKLKLDRLRLIGKQDRKYKVTCKFLKKGKNVVFKGTLFSILDFGTRFIQDVNSQRKMILERTTFWLLDNLDGAIDHIFINQNYISEFSQLKENYVFKPSAETKKKRKHSLVHNFSVGLVQKKANEEKKKPYMEVTIIRNGEIAKVIRGKFANMLDTGSIFWYFTDIDIKKSKYGKDNSIKCCYNQHDIGTFKLLAFGNEKVKTSKGYWKEIESLNIS